jgi:hypothetical protein
MIMALRKSHKDNLVVNPQPNKKSKGNSKTADDSKEPNKSQNKPKNKGNIK